ncbi:MAG: hypothetical protein HFE49_05370 [Clostridia bacterium]|nr:hypothetical protein [Clostridia bacterium]
MINIISAFGGQNIQDALYKDMQGQNMFFSLEDCNNGISLIMAVEQHPDIDVIVIGHMWKTRISMPIPDRLLYSTI